MIRWYYLLFLNIVYSCIPKLNIIYEKKFNITPPICQFRAVGPIHASLYQVTIVNGKPKPYGKKRPPEHIIKAYCTFKIASPIIIGIHILSINLLWVKNAIHASICNTTALIMRYTLTNGRGGFPHAPPPMCIATMENSIIKRINNISNKRGLL